jgi:GGDEF domain-containing protein
LVVLARGKQPRLGGEEFAAAFIETDVSEALDLAPSSRLKGERQPVDFPQRILIRRPRLWPKKPLLDGGAPRGIPGRMDLMGTVVSW